jgi:hypothetical protein
MADIETDMKPATAVFIDVPNIASHIAHWKTGLKWERLSQAIAASEVLIGTHLMCANAYVSTWDDREPLLDWKRGAFKTFGGTAFEMVVRHMDDIDSMIIEDMWQAVAQREQQSIRDGVISYPIRMRFILVSGDGDYMRTINKMRQAYGENLELELIVYSWNEKLSECLMLGANTVVPLDKVRNFVRRH